MPWPEALCSKEGQTQLLFPTSVSQGKSHQSVNAGWKQPASLHYRITIIEFLQAALLCWSSIFNNFCEISWWDFSLLPTKVCSPTSNQAWLHLVLIRAAVQGLEFMNSLQRTYLYIFAQYPASHTHDNFHLWNQNALQINLRPFCCITKELRDLWLRSCGEWQHVIQLVLLGFFPLQR